MYTVGVYRSGVPARRAPRKHLTDTTQDACSLYGGSSAMHGRIWPTCTELQPQYRSNNIVCPFIFVVTVAAPVKVLHIGIGALRVPRIGAPQKNGHTMLYQFD